LWLGDGAKKGTTKEQAAIRALKSQTMEAVLFFESAMSFYRATQPYIPEDNTLNTILFETNVTLL
jgi:hypothetical protein